MHQVTFFIPEKVCVMDFVELFFAILSISSGGLEWWRIGVKLGHIKEGITDDIPTNAKLIWEFAKDGMNFLCNWFVFLLHRKKYIGEVGEIREPVRRGR